MTEIKPHEWATFHIRIRLDEADYDYYDEGYHGHGDRLVLEYYDKPQDKVPVERLYFEFSYNYDGTVYAADAIKELLDTLAYDQEEAAKC